MQENQVKKRRGLSSNFRFPHSYVIIFCIIVLMAIMSYIIPAGQFDRAVDPTSGREVVVPGTFHYVDQKPVSPFQLFVDIQEGFISAADIIFFIVFAYGFVYMLIKNGTFDALIGGLLRIFGKRISILIPVCMTLFIFLGSTVGILEETYGMVPIFIGLAIAMGYDAIVGSAMVYVGAATGFAAATLNPFTIGVAQQIAGVEYASGIFYRIFCAVVFGAIAIGYTMWYAHRVKKDPTKSILYGEERELGENADHERLRATKATVRQKLCGVLFIFTIALLLYGTVSYGWYINQLAGMFLVMMIVVGLVGGFGPSKIAATFLEAGRGVLFGALAVGISRSILIVMEDACIIDTIVYFLSSLLQGTSGYLSAVGMLVVQNIVNFFIPSGSGQAAVTMPLMAPLADMIGLSRQTAVLAFQFGDGFSNMFWPTSVCTMCGIMGVPVNKWYKFVAPMFGFMFLAQVILICGAVAINYV
ncbi:MAG TPA: TIGR00366 family protein [Candidatus Pygmaiobacter gallistercoris]|nr:TIGR00366 family protein [Candidatus Pygmaiobacter gallistercoris]